MVVQGSVAFSGRSNVPFHIMYSIGSSGRFCVRSSERAVESVLLYTYPFSSLYPGAIPRRRACDDVGSEKPEGSGVVPPEVRVELRYPFQSQGALQTNQRRVRLQVGRYEGRQILRLFTFADPPCIRAHVRAIGGHHSKHFIRDTA